jgi:hypothetical protein
MVKKMPWLLVWTVFGLFSASAWGQGKLKSKLTMAEVKQTFEDLDYECKVEKSADGKLEWCLVTRAPKTYIGRVQLYDDGTTLAADVQYPGLAGKISLAAINAWNIQALHTRAVLVDDKTGPGAKIPQLEADLDCGGGITSRTLARFIRRFEEKGQEFSIFLSKAEDEKKRAVAPGNNTTPKIEGFNLVGTVWKGNEDLQGYGELTFEFKSGNVAIMIDKKNRSEGTWSQVKDKVELDFKGNVYRGQITGQTLAGQAEITMGNNKGQAWKFKVTLQGPGGESPNPKGTKPKDISLPQDLPAVFRRGDRDVEIHFPTSAGESWQTAWKITWDLETIQEVLQAGKIPLKMIHNRNKEANRPLHFKIKSAYFKPGKTAPWIQVLEDAYVSEFYVPYHDPGTAWYDLRDHGYLDTLQEHEIRRPGKLLGKEKVVAAELRDRGLVYKNGTNSGRGQELALWTNFNARNYTYFVEMLFADDGSIVFRHAPTGMNLMMKEDKSNVYFPHLGHMHNACWRIGVKLGPEQDNAVNEVFLARHLEFDRVKKMIWDKGHKASGQGDKVSATAIDVEERILKEGGQDWNPAEFTKVRFTNPNVFMNSPKGVKNIHPISYDLIAFPSGTARHHKTRTDKAKDNALFTQHDFWITSADSPVFHYPQLGTYFDQNEPNYLNGNVVLWHMSSVLHVPRAEDGIPQQPGANVAGQALASWSTFELRPRNIFTGTPLYTWNQAQGKANP